MNPLATTRRERLRSLKLDPQALTAKAGRTYSYWRDLLTNESKSFGEKAARSIEEALGLPSGWLDEPPPSRVEERPAPSYATARHSLPMGMAQSVSPVPFNTPPTIKWGDVVKLDQFPGAFVLEVPDSAIAPKHMAGTRIVWHSDAQPKPGKAVLVKDRGGECFVRIYGNVRAAHWQAIALDIAYSTLDSQADGLTVLAVAQWIEA